MLNYIRESSGRDEVTRLISSLGNALERFDAYTTRRRVPMLLTEVLRFSSWFEQLWALAESVSDDAKRLPAGETPEPGSYYGD